MQPVKFKDGNLNLEDSYVSLVNKETQTDATDSFLENYYVRFHRSQNSSAIQSENSIKLLGYCYKKGEGTVTIKDNKIIIQESIRRNPPTLIENISQNPDPPGQSAYCEEVLIPYLKTPPPDCELDEHLKIDFPEDIPDQPDTQRPHTPEPDIPGTKEKDMKDNKTNSGGKCDRQDAKPLMERPETTELTDLGRGLKYVASALFSPLCKNCEAKTGDVLKNQDADDPCKKSSSTQQLIETMSNVSLGIKNVASKMMSAICPNKSPHQSQTSLEKPPVKGPVKSLVKLPVKPPEKLPDLPPPEPEVTESGSTSSVRGAYTACKKKTIGIAKGVRNSISNLLCTPCPCPKQCEPVPCSAPNMAASPEDDQPLDCAPKVEASDISPVEESPLGKKPEEEPACPVVKGPAPCPPPEEKLPCQPIDVELPPCKKKVIEKPPCPPDENKPPCLPPRKEKKCPPKDRNCTPKDKCKIKDPVMAVRMPLCKGEKPRYYLTDRSKICKSCLSKGNLSNDSSNNVQTEDVSFDSTPNDKALPVYSLNGLNISDLNKEIEPKKESIPDFENRSNIDVESSTQSNRLPRVVSLHNKMKSDETVSNFENDSSISIEPSTQYSKIAHVVSLNNEIKSNSAVGHNFSANEDQGLSLKDRLVKSLTDVKDSMTYLAHTVRKNNEPTSVLSEESQLIKITETASTEKKSSVMNINKTSDLEDQKKSDNEANEATTLERASNMMAPIVARLAGAVDSTMTTLKERLDLERFSSVQETVREATERSSPYDKQSMISVPAPTKELSSTDSEPVPGEPSSLTKSVFTTIKSKLFGMFSDRERTDNTSSSAGPVLRKASRASVRFKNSDGSLD